MRPRDGFQVDPDLADYGSGGRGFRAAFLVTILAAVVVAGVLGYELGFVHGRHEAGGTCDQKVEDLVAHYDEDPAPAAWRECEARGGNWIMVYRVTPTRVDSICEHRGEPAP